MTALARLITAIDIGEVHEISDAYPEAVREYHANIRANCLRREVAVIRERLVQIEFAKAKARLQGKSTAWLYGEWVKQSRRLAECRDELARLQR